MILKSVIKKTVIGNQTICRGVNFWIAKISKENPSGGWHKDFLRRQDNRDPERGNMGDIQIEITEPGVYQIVGQMREDTPPENPVFNGYAVMENDSLREIQKTEISKELKKSGK